MIQVEAFHPARGDCRRSCVSCAGLFWNPARICQGPLSPVIGSQCFMVQMIGGNRHPHNQVYAMFDALGKLRSYREVRVSVA